MANPIFIIDIGPHGAVAVHPRRFELPVLVAPVPEEKKKEKFNAIRPQLVAIACMRVNEKPGFEFDSSFPSPGAEPVVTKFADLMRALQQQDPARRFPPCSVFGHADPTGDPVYNKTLSGRRALAIYALLTRDTKIWDRLYNIPHGGDRWTYKAIQKMLSVSLIRKPVPEPPFYTGEIDGGKTPKTQKETHEAIKAYQAKRGLAQTGFANDETRKALFTEYMDLICHHKDDTRFVLDPVEHFIAKKKDPALRGDVQGCSEFNPVFLLSKAEEELFASSKELHEGRNALYAEDRRVVVYAFKHDSEIDPQKWPCPAPETGSSACEQRFWSDHKRRLERGEDQRKFEDTRDTMACRFYHAFSFYSPCEAGSRLWIVRLQVDGLKEMVPLKHRRYVLKLGSTEFAPVIRGTTDEKGEIRFPVLDERALMTLKIDAWGKLFAFPDQASGTEGQTSDEKKFKEDKPGGGVDEDSGFDTDKFDDEERFVTIQLDAGALLDHDSSLDEPSQQRLYNLGFGQSPPLAWSDQERKRAVKQYQRSRKLEQTGNLTPAQRDQIRTEHELTDVTPEEEEKTTTAVEEI